VYITASEAGSTTGISGAFPGFEAVFYIVSSPVYVPHVPVYGGTFGHLASSASAFVSFFR